MMNAWLTALILCCTSKAVLRVGDVILSPELYHCASTASNSWTASTLSRLQA